MDELRLKSEIQNGHNEFFNEKLTHLPLHNYGDYILSPIIFILSEHVANYDNMPYG